MLKNPMFCSLYLYSALGPPWEEGQVSYLLSLAVLPVLSKELDTASAPGVISLYTAQEHL